MTKLGRPPRADRPTRKTTLEDSQGFGRLTVNGIEDDKEYYYRVVNDKNNRVHQLQQLGFEIVENNSGIVMGDSNPSEAGSAVIATCDQRDGSKAILMRQRKEWRDEDEAFKQSEVDKGEEAIFRTLKEEGQYGEITKN